MPPQRNSIQNLSRLTLKTKELHGSGGKHSLVLHQPKKLGMNRIKKLLQFLKALTVKLSIFKNKRTSHPEIVINVYR